MKAYNLKTEKVEVAKGVVIDAIVLGEEGRARRRVIVPCSAGIADGDDVVVGQTRTGRLRIDRVRREDSNCAQWLARIDTRGAYVRNARGMIRVAHGAAFTIARGRGAYGQAGRVGSWIDDLLVVPDHALLRVKPARWDAYFLYFAHDRVHRIEQSAIDIFLDTLPNTLDVTIPADPTTLPESIDATDLSEDAIRQLFRSPHEGWMRTDEIKIDEWL